MSWNHRVLAHKSDIGEDMYLQIHEVYYDEGGKPNGCTKDGVSVGADNIEDMNWVIGKMKECLDKPILLADDFPNEYIVK